MAKRIYGSICQRKGKLYARLRLQLPDGGWRDITRRAKNRTHAKTLLDQLHDRYNEGGAAAIRGETMTFAELADLYKSRKAFAAIYQGERKVSGLKHPEKVRWRVDKLIEHWGAWLIRDITYSDIESYKVKLIRTPTKWGQERSIYDVNHYLRQLRIILNFARQNRWLRDNPFNFGEPLINAADELPRERPERPGEIERLLEVCTGRRAHLKVIILLAIDTALRPAELLRLKAADIDFDEKLVEAKATVTKTNRRRIVPISDRTADALRDWLNGGYDLWAELLSLSIEGATPTLFANVKSINTAWRAACEAADIENLQFKDLRHWATTAMVETGLPDKQIMKITGHTQERTFRRYINTDKETVQRVGEALEHLRREKVETGEVSDFTNLRPN